MTQEIITRENPFHHNKSIRVGLARVPYDDTSGIKGGVVCLAGWVLPGGRRTQDYTTAYKMAEAMDELMRAPVGAAVIG